MSPSPLRRHGARGVLRPRSAPHRGVLATLISVMILACVVVVPGPAARADAALPPAPLAVLVISNWDWHRVLAGFDTTTHRSSTADATSAGHLADSANLADPANDENVATELAALAEAGSPTNLVPRTAAATPSVADGLATLTAGARAAAPSTPTPAGYNADPQVLAESLAKAGLTFRFVTASDGNPSSTSTGATSMTASSGDTSPDTLANLTLIDGTGQSAAYATRGLALLTTLRQAAARAGTDLRVVVVSVAEGSNDPQILILPAHTAGWGGRQPLASASTHQTGWVQLTDLAPTLLSALGVPIPPAMTGQPLTLPASSVTALPATSDAAAPSVHTTTSALTTLRSLADASARARASHAVTLPMCLLILLLGLAPLLLAAWTTQRVTGRAIWRIRLVAAWGAVLPAGAWLASLLPWWRLVDPAPTNLAGGAILFLVPAGLSLIFALVLVVTCRQLLRLPFIPPPSPAVLIASLTAALILVDAATGARLGFNGTLGMDAVVAGRFYGVSNTAFALAGAALVVAIGAGTGPWVVDGVRWNRPVRAVLAVGLSGALALGLDALPATGADVGGGLTLVVALGVLAVTLAGVRLRLRHLAELAGGAVVLLAGIGLADWASGPRTHLGRLAGHVLTGHVDDAAATLTRKVTSLVAPFLASPLALAALVVGLAVIVVAVWWLRRDLAVWRAGPQVSGGLDARHSGLTDLLPSPHHRAWQWLRPTLLGLGTLIVVEVLVNDSGASMAWLSVALAAPLLTITLISEARPRVAPRDPERPRDPEPLRRPAHAAARREGQR